MPNFIKIRGGQEYFGLFLVDFIWNASLIIVENMRSNCTEHRLGGLVCISRPGDRHFC